MAFNRRKLGKKRRMEERRGKPLKTSDEKRSSSDRRGFASRRQIKDRREHIRFPIVGNYAKPIEFRTFPLEIKETQPGIITHLSANGLALISFTPVSVGAQLIMSIELPKYGLATIEGHVARVEEKGGSYLAGIKFNKIPHEAKKTIDKLANDYADCELKISFGIKDVCFRKCGYFDICDKPQKLK